MGKYSCNTFIICMLITENQCRKSRFGTLVATEEFPYDVVLQPSPPTPAVIKSLQLANGIHTISREYNSSVRSLLDFNILLNLIWINLII